MEVNWQAITALVSPVIVIFINRAIEQKPKLIVYFTHATLFNLTGNPPTTIHTHGIVIKNTGKKPAIDIRVRHRFLPQYYNIFPSIQFTVDNLSDGGAEIVFPRLVPNEQISISYLYLPPVVYSQIHAGVRHSDGFATVVTALPNPQYPTWIRRGILLLLILGIITFVYFLLEISCYFWTILGHRL